MAKAKHPLFYIHRNMLDRCLNPSSKDWDNYGGRGIKVCKAWQDSIESFAEDMGPRPAGYTVERINNDSHYQPSNCKWATMKEQNNNRRKPKRSGKTRAQIRKEIAASKQLTRKYIDAAISVI